MAVSKGAHITSYLYSVLMITLFCSGTEFCCWYGLCVQYCAKL